MIWLWSVALVGIAMAVGLALAARVGRAGVARREATLLQGARADPAEPVDLPPRIRQAALRSGAGVGPMPRAVRLRQHAELLFREGGTWRPITARQVIAVPVAGLSWVATMRRAGLPLMRVWDGYFDGTGLLQVHLFGVVPVTSATGPDMDLGEAMRYLAELPWAPDAMLHNRAIRWHERDDGWIEAALTLPDATARVRFRLDDAGDIVEIRAEGRPARLPDGRIELRDWRGLFSDYTEMGHRRIPARAVVGYVTAGHFAPYFRGEITRYEIVH